MVDRYKALVVQLVNSQLSRSEFSAALDELISCETSDASDAALALARRAKRRVASA